MSRKPGYLEGASAKPDPPGLADAIARLLQGRRGPATDSDRPAPSTFPMTAAARAARRFDRQYGV